MPNEHFCKSNTCRVGGNIKRRKYGDSEEINKGKRKKRKEERNEENEEKKRKRWKRKSEGKGGKILKENWRKVIWEGNNENIFQQIIAW